MSDYEIITDGGRRRRWSAAEKIRIVEETLEDGASISVIASRNVVASNLLYRWRRLMGSSSPAGTVRSSGARSLSTRTTGRSSLGEPW